MIIIINGPYGVGKTTVTKNLIKKIPSSILFDTERLGFFLYDLIPDNKKCDWIEIDLWKQFVVDVGLFVKKEYNQNIIIPQTILNKSTLSFILNEFKNKGEKVYYFCLMGKKEILKDRLIKRVKEQGMEHLIGTSDFYAFERIDECLEVFGGEKSIDTSDKSINEISNILLSKIDTRYEKKSWLRNEDVYPIVPNIDVFVNWLMDIKDHPNLKKFNAYLWGGFITSPQDTEDIDVLITKRDGQHATLKELEELMVDMFDSAYDTHGFFLDTCYMRIPQWIGDYPRNKEFLKSVERKQLFITITKNEDKGIVCKYKRYGKLNCCYMSSFGPLSGWDKEDSALINRWVDLDANYAKMVDLRRIIKYYDNNKERNIGDFLNEFQEYSGY